MSADRRMMDVLASWANYLEAVIAGDDDPLLDRDQYQRELDMVSALYRVVTKENVPEIWAKAFEIINGSV